eukprot:jgi/Hompol1/3669/HPOL_006706-RA
MDGVLVHELVHVVQFDGFASAPWWWIEGIADWIRLRAGLAARHWKQTKGGSWTDGYSTTGYFLEWIETHVDGVQGPGRGIRNVNAALSRNLWSEKLVFAEMGLAEPTTFQALWEMIGSQTVKSSH